MVKKGYLKICILSTFCVMQPVHSIYFEQTLHRCSSPIFSFIKKHRVAAAAITAISISAILIYKPLMRFIFKKPHTPHPNEAIIKKTIATIRAESYYISPIVYITELNLEKWYKKHYDCNTMPFMAINIYENNGKLINQKYITVNNITLLEYYRNLHEQYKNLHEQNEAIIKKIIATIRAKPYYISETTRVTELHLERWYEHHYDCNTMPFMAINIYEKGQFVEKKYITAKNITLLEHYRTLHEQYKNTKNSKKTRTSAG